MTLRPPPAAFALDAPAAEAPRRDLLRFITCGSVDDGKSTLIGRLLFESKNLFDDQAAALARDSGRYGTQGAALDLALLVDGLSAEREQGITIDVAYRFFSTERRSFIVADTPGHEEYTRNMATGASTADLAVLLVDASKGLSPQTRRHSLIVSMLGIRRVVVAVNKMDLVGWSRESFATIMAEYRAFAAGLGFAEIAGIPLSARDGDNVTSASANTPWYRGPALLPFLEEVETGQPADNQPFRMPVQWVNRPDLTFRGFSGLVTGGSVRPGDVLRVQPSGEETRVARIVTYDGDLVQAVAGQSVTLTLADEVDVSRGSTLVAVDRPGELGDRLEAQLFWMARDNLAEGRSYLLKLGAQSAVATVARVRARIDLATLAETGAAQLAANDIGEVTLALDRPVAWDAYAANRDSGGFILIDRESFDTIGIGLAHTLAESRDPLEARSQAADEPRPPARFLSRSRETARRSAAKAVSWRVLGTLLTLAATFGLTGSLGTALSVGAIEVGTKLVLYFGHERVWARIGMGLRTRANPCA